MVETYDDLWYHEDGPDWEQPEPPEHFWCVDCQYVHKVELKWTEDMQGDGVMTGTVSIATGDARCTNCLGEDLFELDDSALYDSATPQVEQ